MPRDGLLILFQQLADSSERLEPVHFALEFAQSRTQHHQHLDSSKFWDLMNIHLYLMATTTI
jgi:hypothetical protein